MKTKPQLLIFDQLEYGKPFERVYDVIYADTRDKLEEGLQKCHTVMFTGGADVSPHLYGEPAHTTTTPNIERDRFEVFMWQRARELNKKILGVCRGAQFACVMSGGKLIQNVYGHTTSHMIDDVFGNSLLMTSTHHQMMRPEFVNGALTIAWSKVPQSKEYKDGYNNNCYEPFKGKEPEIVYFASSEALAIQGHPENTMNTNLHNYVCDLVEFYLFNQQDKKQPFYPRINPAV